MEKYKSHYLLAEIGKTGQEKIFKAKILIIGLGGLGTPIIRYLASSGVENFCLIDDDIIELSNLPRQNNYALGDLEKSKAEISAKIIKELNPQAQVEIYKKRANNELLEKLIPKHDYLIDASDNFNTKFLLSNLSLKYKKTLISGSFIGFSGYVGIYKSWLNKSLPCFSCFHHNIDKNIEKSCNNKGVFSAGVGTVGAFMATEILKEIIDLNSLAGKIMLFDFLNNKHRVIKLAKNPDCSHH